MKLQLEVSYSDIFLDENESKERVGHEMAKIGSWLRNCFQLFQVTYRQEGDFFIYEFECPTLQGNAIHELMGALTTFNVRTIEP